MMNDTIARMNKENAALKKELGLNNLEDDDPELRELNNQLKKPRMSLTC